MPVADMQLLTPSHYMDAKEMGRTGWIGRNEAHGTMWCSPGPYVEVSMFKVLAKQVSGCFLPEAFYENMTFRDGEETEHSVKSEVEVSAVSLGVRIKDERDKRGANLGEDSDGEDGRAEDYLETDDDEEVGEWYNLVKNLPSESRSHQVGLIVASNLTLQLQRKFLRT